MYQNIFISRDNIVHLWDDNGYHRFKYDNYAFIKNFNGDHESIFGDKLAKIYNWNLFFARDNYEKYFETDVRRETRVLVNKYYNSDGELPKGHRLLYFDIETGGISMPSAAKKEITAISFYDRLLDEYFVLILDKNNEIKETQNNNVKILSFTTEYDLLKKFIDLWQEISPTIITGWNTDYFDVPYLYNRMTKVLGQVLADRLSPIGEIYWNKRRKRYMIAGVSSLDYLSLYKKFTFSGKPLHTLDYIAKEEVGRGKIKYEGSLEKLFLKDIKKYIEYNLNDTQLVVDIDKKLGFIDLTMAICHTCNVPLEDIYFNSRWIEGAMMTLLKKIGNIISPSLNPESLKMMQKREDSLFEGAFVKSPEKKIFEWLYDLDFTSLYPSIIISLNMSPETKIGKVFDWNPYKFAEDDDAEFDGELYYAGQTISFSHGSAFGTNKVKGKELRKSLKKENFSIAANGVIYDMNKKGIMPMILEEWFKDKVKYSNLAIEMDEKDEKEKAKYYEERTKVTKVMLNSFFGVCGLPSFRFYDIDNAEAITMTGQLIVKHAESEGNKIYNKILNDDKEYCIYMDTDSVDGKSSIFTDFFGNISIENLFNNLIEDFNDKNGKFTKKLSSKPDGRIFVFTKNLKSKYFDEKNKKIHFGDVEYIEKHNTKKKMFKVETENGNFVNITEDQSIMVFDGEKLIEKKPTELKSSDHIIELI